MNTSLLRALQVAARQVGTSIFRGSVARGPLMTLASKPSSHVLPVRAHPAFATRATYNAVAPLAVTSSQQTAPSGTGSLLLLAAAGLGATASFAEMKAASPQPTLREKFVELFPNEDDSLIDNYEAALKAFKRNKDPGQAVILGKALVRKIRHLNHLCVRHDKEHNLFLNQVYDQALRVYRKIENKFPAVIDNLDPSLNVLENGRDLVQREMRLFEMEAKNVEVMRISRSFFEEMARNPLAVASAGGVVAGGVAAGVQYLFAGPINPWVVAGWAGGGFLGAGGAILLYDHAYNKNIWKDFKADHPLQAFAFSAINLVLVSYGISVAAGKIPNDAATVKMMEKCIGELKDVILKIPVDAKYKDHVVNLLAGFTNKNLTALLNEAKDKFGSAKANLIFLEPGFIDNKQVCQVVSRAVEDIKVIIAPIVTGSDPEEEYREVRRPAKP